MENTIHANKRNNLTKGENTKLRNSGRIPGAIYGLNNQNFNVEFSKDEVFASLKKVGEHGIVNVDIEGNTEKVMFKEIQRNPISSNIIHVDLQRVDASHKVHTKIPIKLKGEDKLKSMGAVAQVQLDEVEIECTADYIPKYITADVSKVPVGSRLTIGDIEISSEIAVLNPPTAIIAAVSYIKDKSIEKASENDEESSML